MAAHTPDNANKRERLFMENPLLMDA